MFWNTPTSKKLLNHKVLPTLQYTHTEKCWYDVIKMAFNCFPICFLAEFYCDSVSELNKNSIFPLVFFKLYKKSKLFILFNTVLKNPAATVQFKNKIRMSSPEGVVFFVFCTVRCVQNLSQRRLLRTPIVNWVLTPFTPNYIRVM